MIFRFKLYHLFRGNQLKKILHIGFRQQPGKSLFVAPATVGEARSLPRSTGFQLTTRMGEFVPVYHICTIQPNTQLTNLAGG